MTTVVNGLLGGLVAGLAAGVVAGLVADDADDAPALAAAAFGARAASAWRSLAGAALYGCLAGGAFVAVELSVLDVLGVPPATWDAVGTAAGWSVALLCVAAAARLARGGSLDRQFVAPLAAYHLTYGLCLGVWIRLTWIT